MAYTNEIIASARRALEEKRQAYENARESRTAEIYKALPQVREMDQQMRTNMIRAVQQALAGGEAAIDRARMQKRECIRQYAKPRLRWCFVILYIIHTAY